MGHVGKTHKLGFQEVQELCMKANRLGPCQHEDHTQGYTAWINKGLELAKGSEIISKTGSDKSVIKWSRILGDGKYDTQGAEQVFGTSDKERTHL